MSVSGSAKRGVVLNLAKGMDEPSSGKKHSEMISSSVFGAEASLDFVSA